MHHVRQAKPSSSAHRHMQQGQLAPDCAAPMAEVLMHMTTLMYDQSTGNTGHG